MTVQCQACHSTTDAYLCITCTDCGQPARDRCGRCLTDLLAELPAAIDDLTVTAARQARVGNLPPRLGAAALAELEQADQEERDLPAHLRSRYGRITLVANELPVSLGAAQLHGQALTGVTSWVQRTAALLGHTVTAGTPQAQCAWLTEHVDQIRDQDHAGDILRAARSLAGWIARAVDRRPPEVFAGQCDAEDVRVNAVPVAGPPCSGLACPHVTCERIRSGWHALAPQVVKCGALLEAAEGETEVECPSCGIRYEVGERRAAAADEAADRLGTTREVAGFLRTITVDIDGQDEQLEVTVDRIDGWLRYGRITAHGRDANNHRLVRIGEVREYAEDWQRRRATRRRRSVA